MPDDAGKPIIADLYEADYVAWAEAQAAALLARRFADLDLENLADEVESLARNDYHACLSFIGLIIEHLLKIQFVRSPQDVPHWRGELVNFREQLEERLTPTLTNRLHLQTQRLFGFRLKALRQRNLIGDPAVVTAALPTGYSWDRIVDFDFYPKSAG